MFDAEQNLDAPKRPPDYYMCSLDDAGEWAKVRECRIEYRVRGPRHSQYAVVRVDPPVFLPASGGTIHTVLVTPRDHDATMFPQSTTPLRVNVLLPSNPGAGFDRTHVRSYDVFLETTGALFPDRLSAERAVAETMAP
ncbi:MAG: hypothetical protein ACO1Q7_12410 [Gemmatimonas sp.]